jgi:predicted metal-dependent HD superfamily phosphohydrolase
VATVVESRAAAEERWSETWCLAKLPAPSDRLARLLARYHEQHRSYHGLQHILSCLRLAAEVRGQLEDPAAVELAVWYHDAIYQPRASDNEERSAALAASELGPLCPLLVPSITSLILATKHQAGPASPDGQFLVDIDLAVLGSSAAEFDTYEADVRREYRWVPRALFDRKRREILQGFVDRPAIYSTRYFRDRLEASARANLARSIDRLS